MLSILNKRVDLDCYHARQPRDQATVVNWPRSRLRAVPIGLSGPTWSSTASCNRPNRRQGIDPVPIRTGLCLHAILVAREARQPARNARRAVGRTPQANQGALTRRGTGSEPRDDSRTETGCRKVPVDATGWYRFTDWRQIVSHVDPHVFRIPAGGQQCYRTWHRNHESCYFPKQQRIEIRPLVEA